MSIEIKTRSASARVAWNKGPLVGQKRPLWPKEVSAIRVQIKRRKRDLAMFNLAIDSGSAAAISSAFGSTTSRAETTHGTHSSNPRGLSLRVDSVRRVDHRWQNGG
jgi:hypothetical protein